MLKKVTATNAKNNFGKVLEEVYVNGNSVEIYKNNRPIAKLVPVSRPKDSEIPAEYLIPEDKHALFDKAIEEFNLGFKLFD